MFISGIDQYSSFHQISAENGIKDICSFLPTEFSKLCDFMVQEFGPNLNEVLENEEVTVDTICHCLGYCFITEGNNLKYSIIFKILINFCQKETSFFYILYNFDKNFLTFPIRI